MRMRRCFSRGGVLGADRFVEGLVDNTPPGGAVEANAGPTNVRMSVESMGHEKNTWR